MVQNNRLFGHWFRRGRDLVCIGAAAFAVHDHEDVEESNSRYAQGGIAAVWNEDDSLKTMSTRSLRVPVYVNAMPLRLQSEKDLLELEN